MTVALIRPRAQSGITRCAATQSSEAESVHPTPASASLRNYLSDQFDRGHSLKRGGNIEFVPLDFDARWAMTLLDETLRRLGEEYGAQRKLTIFKTLKPFLGPAGSQKLLPYEEIAARLDLSVGGVKTLVHRLRKRYTELLREEVARTVTDPKEVDEEIHALCEALIAAEGRLGS
jgi:hypothetical protein